MDVRAAVAFEAGKPLAITTAQLDGPNDSARIGEWIRRFLTAPQSL